VNILYKVAEEDKEDFGCEVCDCPNRADLYVEDFDGDSGYICQKCYDEDLAESQK
jgi:hypothetical protein